MTDTCVNQDGVFCGLKRQMYISAGFPPTCKPYCPFAVNNREFDNSCKSFIQKAPIADEFRDEIDRLTASNTHRLELLKTVVLDHNELMQAGHPVTVRMSTIADARTEVFKAAMKGEF